MDEIEERLLALEALLLHLMASQMQAADEGRRAEIAAGLRSVMATAAFDDSDTKDPVGADDEIGQGARRRIEALVEGAIRQVARDALRLHET